MEAPVSLAPGAIIGKKYQILSVIGIGGFAIVYVA